MCTRFGFMLCALLLLFPPAGAAEREERVPDAGDVAEALVERLRSDDARVRYEALQAAFQNQHPSLTGPLIKALRDDYPENRKRAAQALARRTDSKTKKRAAIALVKRLPTLSGKEERSEELVVVTEALGDLGQKTSVKPLLKGLDPKTPRAEAVARLKAVAQIPHAEAIEGLMQYGSKGRRGNTHGKLVIAALQHATGQKFGKDPDAWRTWWRENKATFDFEAAAREREAQQAREQEKADKKNRRKKDGKRRKRKDDTEEETG